MYGMLYYILYRYPYNDKVLLQLLKADASDCGGKINLFSSINFVVILHIY